MKLTEAIRRHRYLSAGSAAFILAAGGTEIAAYSSNPTYDAPEHACASPFVISPVYPGQDVSTFWQTYTGIATPGVVAAGELPKGAYGVEASFAAPNSDEETWEHNASDMLKADHSGKYALKLAVGSGDVQFAVRVIAPEHSELCETTPDAAFTYKHSDAYGDASGQLPWPNPVNAVTELF